MEKLLNQKPNPPVVPVVKSVSNKKEPIDMKHQSLSSNNMRDSEIPETAKPSQSNKTGARKEGASQSPSDDCNVGKPTVSLVTINHPVEVSEQSKAQPQQESPSQALPSPQALPPQVLPSQVLPPQVLPSQALPSPPVSQAPAKPRQEQPNSEPITVQQQQPVATERKTKNPELTNPSDSNNPKVEKAGIPKILQLLAILYLIFAIYFVFK